MSLDLESGRTQMTSIGSLAAIVLHESMFPHLVVALRDQGAVGALHIHVGVHAFHMGAEIPRELESTRTLFARIRSIISVSRCDMIFNIIRARHGHVAQGTLEVRYMGSFVVSKQPIIWELLGAIAAFTARLGNLLREKIRQSSMVGNKRPCGKMHSQHSMSLE